MSCPGGQPRAEGTASLLHPIQHKPDYKGMYSQQLDALAKACVQPDRLMRPHLAELLYETRTGFDRYQDATELVVGVTEEEGVPGNFRLDILDALERMGELHFTGRVADPDKNKRISEDSALASDNSDRLARAKQQEAAGSSTVNEKDVATLTDVVSLGSQDSAMRNRDEDDGNGDGNRDGNGGDQDGNCQRGSDQGGDGGGGDGSNAGPISQSQQPKSGVKRPAPIEQSSTYEEDWELE